MSLTLTLFGSMNVEVFHNLKSRSLAPSKLEELEA